MIFSFCVKILWATQVGSGRARQTRRKYVLGCMHHDIEKGLVTCRFRWFFILINIWPCAAIVIKSIYLFNRTLTVICKVAFPRIRHKRCVGSSFSDWPYLWYTDQSDLPHAKARKLMCLFVYIYSSTHSRVLSRWGSNIRLISRCFSVPHELAWNWPDHHAVRYDYRFLFTRRSDRRKYALFALTDTSQVLKSITCLPQQTLV